ncbi:hypothetical protein JCM10207_003364 [Rhodosporidiobolus poonsookiae]
MSREELRNGTWWVERVELEWLKEAGDGTFSQRADDGSILLTDLAKNESRVLVHGEDVKDARTGQRLDWSTFAVSPDMQYILFGSDWKKQWRHSSLQHFHLHRLSPPLTLLLSPPSVLRPSLHLGPPADLPRALRARIAHARARARQRRACLPRLRGRRGVCRCGSGGGDEGAARRARAWEGAVRVTQDGEESVRCNGGEVEAGTVFNGVNDWVYEEEVFSRPSSLFFSPAASHLAFLSFDEAAVPLFDFPVYSDKDLWEQPGGGADEYPGRRAMRYPKSGYPNPLVTIRLFSLSAFLSSPSCRPSLPSSSSPTVTPGVSSYLSTLVLDRPTPPSDFVVSELASAGEKGLLMRVMSRDAAVERVGLFEVREEDEEGRERRGRTVRETDWVEKGQTISSLLPSSPSSLSSTAPVPAYPRRYLDVLSSPSGHLHLAYCSPPDAAEPILGFLSCGRLGAQHDGGQAGQQVIPLQPVHAAPTGAAPVTAAGIGPAGAHEEEEGEEEQDEERAAAAGAAGPARAEAADPGPPAEEHSSLFLLFTPDKPHNPATVFMQSSTGSVTAVELQRAITAPANQLLRGRRVAADVVDPEASLVVNRLTAEQASRVDKVIFKPTRTVDMTPKDSARVWMEKVEQEICVGEDATTVYQRNMFASWITAHLAP